MRFNDYVNEKAGDGTWWLWHNDEDADQMKLSNPKRGKWYGAGGDFDFERKTRAEAEKQLKTWGYTYVGVNMD